jgi:ABC-type branched-subunit amino acid transport system substrate-binding protein
MRRRQALAGTAIAAASWALASGPERALAAGADRAPIRLGQSAPVSGPLARQGLAFRDAARAVLEDANAQGGVAGRRLELVTMDDENSPERTAVNVKLLASEHRVSLLFGFVGAGAHRAGPRGAREEGLPYVAAMSGSQELRSGVFPWVFNVRAGHVDEIRFIARHTRLIGIERLSLLTEYNSQGWELRDALMAAAESQGRQVASISSVDHDGGAYSLTGAVSSVLAGRPEAVLVGADYVASARFVDAVRRGGFTGLFYTLSTVGGDALMERLGPLATGVSVTQVMPFPWSSASLVGRRFQAFCQHHALQPSFPAMEAYVATGLLVDALRGARGFAPAQIAEALAVQPPRDLGGFLAAFTPGESDRRTPAQVDLTVFSRDGKFLQ